MSGVFSKNDIATLIANGRIKPHQGYFDLSHVNNSSLDLTIIPDEIYEVPDVLKPRQEKDTVREINELTKAKKHNVDNPLLAGKTYLAKALDINFPPGIYGYSDAKSTSGRLFLQSRVLMDYVSAYDTVDLRHRGLTGELWIVLQPLVFDILIGITQPAEKMERFLQLRVFDGDTRFSNADLLEFLQHHDILYRRPAGNESPQPYDQGDLNLFTHNGSIIMTLFARGEAPIGYKALRASTQKRDPICLSDRDLDPRPYYEPIYATQLHRGNDRSWGVWQEANEHYLLPTNELIHVPDNLTLNLEQLDRRHGDTITHFAGYVDPGFGKPSQDRITKAEPITLEMRSPRDVFLQDKRAIVTGVFERMRSATEPYKGNYSTNNSARLPKQFASFVKK